MDPGGTFALLGFAPVVPVVLLFELPMELAPVALVVVPARALPLFTPETDELLLVLAPVLPVVALLPVLEPLLMLPDVDAPVLVVPEAFAPP